MPFADSMGAIADAQKAGKIRHVGVSNVTVKQLDEARKICPIVFTNSGSRGDISAIVHRHTRAGERENGQIVRRRALRRG